MPTLRERIDPVVFWGCAITIGAFVAWGLVGPESLGSVMSTALNFLLGNFGWVFVLISGGGLVMCLVLVVHPFGKIRLGPDDSRPEFNTFSWVSMMFAAGLGAGLLFYGTAEPISHWAAPPHGEAEPRSAEAAEVALRYTYFHWGFNGWALYALMGGALAYFAFRKGMPLMVSSTFSPVLGPDAPKKPLGRLVDALAIVATLFGTATALGLNGLQLNSGLDYLFGIERSNTTTVIIIVVVTALFVLSATSGVEKGIQFLANMGSVTTILLFFFFLLFGGATVLVVSQGVETIGDYIFQVLPMSFDTGVGDEDWMAAWTIFYWAWWISWAPFVGMFVARISRGRTIREFVLGVAAAPTGFGFLWFAVVGGTGIDLQVSGKADLVATVATPELSLFQALDALPFPVVTSAICVFLVALFFISGADAAAVVMSTMASRGELEPPRIITIALGVLMGGIACAMLLVGGLTALQQAAELGAAPFALVTVGVAYCWMKALREDRRKEELAGKPDAPRTPAEESDAEPVAAGSGSSAGSGGSTGSGGSGPPKDATPPAGTDEEATP